MSITAAQYEDVSRLRSVYFGTPAGRAALHYLLVQTKLFVPPGQGPVTLDGLLFGLTLLRDLGVLDESNQRRLIDAMAGLPMPDVERNEHGET